MEISQIQLFDLFRSKFGDKEAEAFVHIIEEKMDTKINQRMQFLATKDDIIELRNATKDDIIELRNATKVEIMELRNATKVEIMELRNATKEDISTLRIAVKDDISVLRLEISDLRDSTKDDMRKLKDELSRTIYLTSLGQLFAIVASVISLTLLLLKK